MEKDTELQFTAAGASKGKRRNIHDEYFAHHYSHKEVVEGFLKANLSRELLDQIDFSSLAKKDREFIPSKFRGGRRADLLWTIKQKEGTDLFLFLHLEHQSKHDELMAVRVMEYHAAIVRAYLQEK